VNHTALEDSETTIITPYGGKLVNLLVQGEEREELTRRASDLKSLQLSVRSLCDIELLATGAFSPLDRFMGRRDYTRVLEEMRLQDGTLFRIPVTLPVFEVENIRIGEQIALRSLKNDLLATMTVEEIFEWRLQEEARLVMGTEDVRHPLVSEMSSWGRYYISGPMKVLNLPIHYDFTELRNTPSQVRAALEKLGSFNVVAFQTRNPIHRAHEELTKRAADQNEAHC
jgi:sulfate adenylyltransferase